MEILKKLYDHSFVRYVAIGGTTFAMDFLLLVLLHDVLGWQVIIAASISYWTSITFNFTTNRLWTFKAGQDYIGKHLVAYLTLLGVNYLVTIGIIAALTDFGVHYAVAKVIAVVVQISWTYLIYKKVIFKTPKIENSSPVDEE